jgi:MOSC domain-containing protein YiiM/ferredoxin-NADP reductase
MRILSVNVGVPREIEIRGKLVSTGIYKAPVDGRRHVGVSGIDGDVRVEPRRLGDAQHAVYAYPHDHYAFWQRYVGRDAFPYGQFGENLTVTGPLETEARMGDVLRMGTATVQVAQPRIPCRKLSARMGGNFSGTFLRSRKVGYYLRVLEPGHVAAGDDVVLLDGDPASPTMDDFVRLTQLDYGDAAGLDGLRAARGLLPEWRAVIEEKRARALAAREAIGGLELEVATREEEGPGVVSYGLRSARGHVLPPFRAGEALPVVTTDAMGGVAGTWRCALSGSPFERDTYRITVRDDLDPGSAPGDGSLALALPARLSIGATVRAAAPRGGFTLDGVGRETGDLLFLCEGLGIAPAVALLEEVTLTRPDVPVRLLHADPTGGARRLREEALRISAAHPRVQIHRFDERPPFTEALATFGGRVFVSGTRQFVDASRSALHGHGVNVQKVRVAQFA